MPKMGKKAPKSAKRARMSAEMRKFHKGQLHSGSKHGPVVTDPAQAKAIGMSESGQSNQSRNGQKVGRKRGKRKGTRKYRSRKRG